MKIGRNEPCPCGSSKKYKNCCLNKKTDENDLFRVMNFGVEIFNKDELDVFSRFFIETNTDEKFEITKSPLGGYVIKDITPPEYTIFAKDYRTIELNDIQRQKVLKHNPQYEYINLGNHTDFEGIIKGGHFSWEREDGLTGTKGTITKLFIRQSFDNITLNINLFPQNEYIDIGNFLDKGFSIYTQSNKLDFFCKDKKLYFENQEVLILSINDKDVLSMDEIFYDTPKEYNVCFDIIREKPFFILKLQEDGLKISLINQKIIDITGIENV